ncbi:hypothetical protein LOAG_09387 [Loa loa]|uniref:Uncharacterized protein n=1 Tax=Loa loa TaxID=7209 RepID=A0A1S0TS14_LOALO|nr:hypothetical protein LOAG_09387 [Loa loa]EFO19110.1 hypothetical protein LOAG_09387 [Loa loa]
MVALVFELIALFTALTYANLSINNGDNVRDIVRGMELMGIIQKIPITSKEVTNTTDCTKQYRIEHYDSSSKFGISPRPYQSSLTKIRWKIKMFWATVIVISILWILILIGLIVIVYIRIVHMHHTISQIFCPKD